jgi:uncharacterized protein YdeI (YjbR/CyaY-like superfamily)
MNKKETVLPFLHKLPSDIKKVLASAPKIQQTWNTLTPLAKNEWICWITSVKKQETKQKHIARLQTDLLNGKKRPCCWPGCPHRNPHAKKWFKQL